MSAICASGQFPTSGTSAFAYLPVQTSPENPWLLVNNYNPLTQAGIAMKRRHPYPENAELKYFVEFLTDFNSPPTPDSRRTATLKKYCYGAP